MCACVRLFVIRLDISMRLLSRLYRAYFSHTISLSEYISIMFSLLPEIKHNRSIKTNLQRARVILSTRITTSNMYYYWKFEKTIPK